MSEAKEAVSHILERHGSRLPKKRNRRLRGGPDLAEETIHLKVVTPILGGAAVTRKIDDVDIIRAPSIRGHLRFWWRALYGHEYQTASVLYTAESALFGRAADEEGGRSPFHLRVDVDQENVGQITGGGNIPPEQFYALWPAGQRPQADRRLPETNFQLVLKAPENDMPVLRNVLRAWILFGGYGSRTRRGLGSLTVTKEADKWLPVEASVEAIKKLFEGIDDIFAEATARETPALNSSILLAGTSNTAMNCWTTALGWLQEFRQGMPGARQSGAEKQQPERPSISNWPEADVIRAVTPAKRRQGNSLDPAHPQRSEYLTQRAWPRAGFGLPINGQFQKKDRDDQYWDQHGKYEPDDFLILWHDGQNEHDRLSSPLILKPLPLAKGQFAPCALWLNRNYPNGQVILRGRTRATTGADFDAHYTTPTGVPEFITQAGTGTLRTAFCNWLEDVKKLTRIIG